MSPFAGALAMTLGFGGSILPIRVEDHEPENNKEVPSASSFRARRKKSMSEAEGTEDLTRLLLTKLDAKLGHEQNIGMKKRDVWLGVLAMVIMLARSHAAMVVLERGTVLPRRW